MSLDCLSLPIFCIPSEKLTSGNEVLSVKVSSGRDYLGLIFIAVGSKNMLKSCYQSKDICVVLYPIFAYLNYPLQFYHSLELVDVLSFFFFFKQCNIKYYIRKSI